MSLFGGLQVGLTGINANQLGLSVAGNNIANASTPGYTREEINLDSIRPTRMGNFNVGIGVSVSGVTSKVDQFLTERARQASGEFEAMSAKSQMTLRVENIFNELTDDDLSTAMNAFFNSIQDVQNNPDDPNLRALVVDKGQFLADSIQSIRQRVDDVRTDISSEVKASADQINTILENVRKLNADIVAAESGSESQTAALRSLRSQELTKLADKIDISIVESPQGAVNIHSGGDFLLFEGQINKVATSERIDRGTKVYDLVFEQSQAKVPTTSGRMGGLQEVRDQEIGQVIDALDALSSTMIYEFNKIHSSGQGLQNFTSVEGQSRVLNASVPLNSPQTGLNFPPQNGSFELKLTNPSTGQIETSVINVDLDGLGADTSLNDLVSQINAAFGTTAASVTNAGKLQIQAPPNVEFTFANDSSGALASLGVNTFFTGNDSSNISVNPALRNNANLFAASSNGQKGDVSNAAQLASFGDKKFAGLSGLSTSQYFTGIVEDLGTMGQTAQVKAGVLQTTKFALESENLAISGVSLDEEAVKLISFQRGFQASARFISTVNQMLDEIIRLGE